MRVDQKLRIRDALKRARSARLNFRQGLSEKDACNIVALALSAGENDRHLRAASQNSKDLLYDCSDEIREQANKLVKKTNSRMKLAADEWLELLKKFNRGAKASATVETVETDYLVVPIMAHLGCDEPQARSIARDLMLGCRSLVALSDAKPRRIKGNGSDIGGQIFYLACAWFDVFDRKPGRSKSDKAPFGGFVEGLLGSAPSTRLSKAIERLDEGTMRDIKEKGFQQWLLGSRRLYFSP